MYHNDLYYNGTIFLWASVLSILLVIVLRILLVYWTMKLAKKNDRDTLPAFFLGLFFGIWAVIGYAIAGKKNG